MDMARLKELNPLALSFQVGGFAGQVLHWGFIPPTPWRNYLHTHSFFEICYSFAGRGVFRLLGKDYAVGAGDIFVARPGEPHEIVAAAADPLGIAFWAHTLTPRHNAFGADAASGELMRAYLGSPGLAVGEAPGVQAILSLLTEETVRRQPGYGEAAAALVAQLVIQSARAVAGPIAVSPPALPAARHPEEAAVQAMTRYLWNNFGQPITLREVAAHVHLSPRHANRLFRAGAGISILRFLRRFRLETAAQLLMEGQLPIKDVAQRCGYPDVRHFMTSFRQHTDVTPGRFRLTSGTVLLPQSESNNCPDPPA